MTQFVLQCRMDAVDGTAERDREELHAVQPDSHRECSEKIPMECDGRRREACSAVGKCLRGWSVALRECRGMIFK